MIPFARPAICDRDEVEVKEVLRSGWISQGPKVKEFEDKLASYVGSRYACAVSSGTAALHLSLMVVGVEPGDVVITVSHTFIATANSIRHCGAEPVFVDVDLDTFNISVESLERLIKKDCVVKKGKLYYKKVKGIGRVAAILPVHQLGMPCDLQAIVSLAEKFNVPVVEDAACALGSEIFIRQSNRWEKIGKPHGELACFSFHPRKVITTGEGGMITTNNSGYDKRLRLLRHHGMSISDAVRHGAKKIIFEKYIMTGYNYRMSDIEAALGISQLKRISSMLSDRRKVAEMYYKGLRDIFWLKLPFESKYSKFNWQSYPVRILNTAPIGRNRLMQYLLDSGISTRRGVMNCHREAPYALNILLKNSELARDSVVLLPLFSGMSAAQVEKVIETIKNV